MENSNKKKVKMIMCGVIVLAITMILLVSSMGKKVLYKEGIYEGVGEGHHGPIKVRVVTDKYRINEIKVIEQQETPELCDIVYDKIPESVINANSTDVDVVAGASLTSRGLINAIENALEKSKVEKNKL